MKYTIISHLNLFQKLQIRKIQAELIDLIEIKKGYHN
jgi:hypothetical protein